MKILIQLFVLLSLHSQAFAEGENCIAEGNVSCEVISKVLPELKLLEEGIRDRYSKLDDKKDFLVFEKEAREYLAVHNQLISCPDFGQKCPSFSFHEYLGDKKSIIASHAFESFGSPCSLRNPVVTYSNSLKKMLAMQLGTNISISLNSDCQDGQSMSFVAYKEGLLVMAKTKESSFSSHAVGRRIPLKATEVRASSPDGKNLRLTWSGKEETFWIDIDPETMTFKESNFMKVDQLNSGTCEVVRQTKPTTICKKQRDQLIKHKSIEKPEEYECFEYVPVIKGVPSKVSRG